MGNSGGPIKYGDWDEPDAGETSGKSALPGCILLIFMPYILIFDSDVSMAIYLEPGPILSWQTLWIVFAKASIGCFYIGGYLLATRRLQENKTAYGWWPFRILMGGFLIYSLGSIPYLVARPHLGSWLGGS